MTRMRGAALLLVLWLVALLTALVGAYALTARMEALQGRVGSRGAMAQEIARAGMEYALVRVADRNPETHWQPNGRAYAWRFDGHEVQVRIIDETGKVDLNQAEVPLLSRLMQALGEPPDTGDALAAAIVDWRDADDLSQPVGGAEDGDYAAAGRPYGAKDAPFETIAELEQVLGMTPGLYARLAPFLTLYSGRGQPDATYAQGPVLVAMGMDATAWLAQREAAGAAGALQLVGTGSGTYSIESRARLADGREASLRTVVRAGASPVPGSAYTLLRWEEGASPQ
ncbi:general secretion pathway protein GspK [Pseudoxanthomonas sp. F37]|uniref:general secretion pathway protein GspK n=1 Tax=Pseudoxanthomonas TaxID=83618 RepID=UPI001FD11FBF|nr:MULTISPECIES: general secretion pathway protein GspK [Pseudoxanthomonas]UOV06535.1 general secretion pathway protein GspK [Pseudoxanthomonas mexicana]UOV08143.1 general secretion pathway protein GspK [Pseudoxanthomonas sp. F37]